MTALEKLALALYDVGAIKFGAFKLKLHEKHPDAPLSPIYLNLRTPDNKDGKLTPEIVAEIGGLLAKRIMRAELKFDHVVGLPRAGDPLAEATLKAMDHGDVGLIHLTKTEKDGNREITSISQGSFMPRDRALIIDDLITKAETKLEAILVLEAADLVVLDIVVLVDREQGGSQDLASAGYNVHSLYTLTQLVDIYMAYGKMTSSKRDEVVAYIAANR